MAKTLTQPGMWASLPFADKDAFIDFLGGHSLWHDAVDHFIRSFGAPAFPKLPLGDGPVDDGGDWHLAHQAIHDGEAAGLGLSGPPDFTAYDLNRRDDFSTWTWLHSQEHVRLEVAAGL